ncbi:MAG: CBS domain-containing protein [Deltaproteobacteria bacterium]|nr:CBS domain-containing protein [Deltaproteobacteria bacterium]
MEVITTHVNADFDTIASMVAAHKLYPEAVLVFPGSQEESVKGFLLQSAFYALEVRKAREIDLSKVTRVVLVDIRNSARVGVFREVVTRPGMDLHIYDHHPDEEADLHGSLEVIRAVGSTTTILVEILKERDVPITPDEATVMMLGIYEDTGSLIFPSTTVADYQAAAHLLACGANLGAVSDILAKDLTSEQISLLYDLIQGSRAYTIHGVEVVIAEARREEYVGDLAVLVHKLRDMEAVNVLFALCQMGDRVVIVGRSRKPEVDVGAVMRELGGGGHPYAASASIRDATTFQVREKIFKVLTEKVIPRRTAADIMVSPPRSAAVENTMADVHQLLTRFNFNAVPVLRGESVAGIITRQVVEKALFHGLGQEKVSEYMNTDFDTVEPGEGIERVQEIIIGKNQRLVPVVGDGHVAGIITRTGFLRFLHDVRDVQRPGPEEDIPAGGILARQKSIANLIRERLPERVVELLRSAGTVAERLGMTAFVVGGFVRDLVMRIDNLDVDIVIEGDGIEFAEAFARENPCRVRPHHKFGTAVLVFPDGFKVDVATARVEYYLEPAALPTVEYSSIKQDLYRRDFTINTLAVRLNPPVFGELIDFYGAQRDIKERVIRILHSLSFVEDPSRILRASRFERRFGFVIGRHTMNLIRNAVRLDLIGRLPKPRLFGELELILKEEDPIGILRRLSEMGIGPSLHPKITLDRKQINLLEETSEVLVWFSLLFLEEKAEKWGVLFLALLDPLSPEEGKKFAADLGMGRKAREWVRIAKDEADDLIYRLISSKAVSRKLVYDCLSPLPNEVILHVMSRAKNPDIKRYISLYFTQLKNVRPLTTGQDLVDLGYPPGPLFKQILDEVLERKFTGELGTKAAEMSFVLTHFPKPSKQGRP